MELMASMLRDGKVNPSGYQVLLEKGKDLGFDKDKVDSLINEKESYSKNNTSQSFKSESFPDTDTKNQAKSNYNIDIKAEELSVSDIEKEKIYKKIDAVKFDQKNIDILIDQMDELLFAFKSVKDYDLQVAIRTKAKSGIFRLEMLNSHQWAKHYKKAFKNPLISDLINVLIGFIIIGAAIAAAYLLYGYL